MSVFELLAIITIYDCGTMVESFGLSLFVWLLKDYRTKAYILSFSTYIVHGSFFSGPLLKYYFLRCSRAEVNDVFLAVNILTLYEVQYVLSSLTTDSLHVS